MNIVEKPIAEIVPYGNNPRNNDSAVDALAASIKEFGFKVPIVLDKDGVIVAGHTRLKAAKKLGLQTVPCVVADDLTPEQVKAFRLADNKTAELATWDFGKLDIELEGLSDFNMERFGFFSDAEKDFPEEEVVDEKYTRKVDTVQYEPTMDSAPPISELFDTATTDSLSQKIGSAEGLSDGERAFLLEAAHRHTAFNYSKIAEFYAHASPKVQELMEESGLVIVDFDDAIKRGWVRLKEKFLAGMEESRTMGGSEDEGDGYEA